MAKIVTIELSDDEFANLQKAFSSNDEELGESDVTEDYVKSRLVNVLKATMRSYDEKNARRGISYTSFSPS